MKGERISKLSRPKFAIAEPQPIYQKIVQGEHNGGVYQNTGIDIVETWHCRVSMSATTHKIFNINKLTNKIVEGVSKCDFAMSRDVACRVSMSITMYKILNINSLSNQIVEDVSKLCAGGRAVQCA